MVSLPAKEARTCWRSAETSASAREDTRMAAVLCTGVAGTSTAGTTGTSASSLSAATSTAGRNAETLSQAALSERDTRISPEREVFRDRLRQPLWPADRNVLILLLVALAVSLALRMIHLMSLFPVLVDESIYLRWAE